MPRGISIFAREKEIGLNCQLLEEKWGQKITLNETSAGLPQASSDILSHFI